MKELITELLYDIDLEYHDYISINGAVTKLIFKNKKILGNLKWLKNLILLENRGIKLFMWWASLMELAI